jgi:hypothetical protein
MPHETNTVNSACFMFVSVLVSCGMCLDQTFDLYIVQLPTESVFPQSAMTAQTRAFQFFMSELLFHIRWNEAQTYLRC